jgi:hypothetical protein
VLRAAHDGIFDMRYPQVCLSTNTSALHPDQTNVKQTEETKKQKQPTVLHAIAASQRRLIRPQIPYSVTV